MEYYEFNGIRFYQTSPKDYCRHSVGHTTILMHKYVWEYYNGKIPSGYDIHHIDGNKANNDISNLQLLTREEHKRLHADQLTEEQREWRRRNLNETARPKAISWHKSEEGRAWHKEQYEKMKGSLYRKIDHTCLCCGKSFQGDVKAKFCCGACKAKYYRQTNKVEQYKSCVICGNMFLTSNSSTRCCSKSCSAKWRWQNRKGN